MDKNLTELANHGKGKIPADLLKKFEVERNGSIFRLDSAPGILVFPLEILEKLGYGEIAKAGFEVVITPIVNKTR
jgi:hypothetical protein